MQHDQNPQSNQSIQPTFVLPYHKNEMWEPLTIVSHSESLTLLFTLFHAQQPFANLTTMSRTRSHSLAVCQHFANGKTNIEDFLISINSQMYKFPNVSHSVDSCILPGN